MNRMAGAMQCLVHLVLLVIKFKKGRRYHNGCPSKTTKKMDITLFPFLYLTYHAAAP